ncbi:Ig-like domain-containing protein [Pseudomonas schmalbachii]|uniref:BapA prefix-like domain-containing protein n=1 Tax=Pseudomonas schmalbachii TaxID=2816993 RepID=A0ABS3TM57_9PSED|nr:Ig-like domain-containing protein [Pseudomonas schmalbachii]MBO3274741.1 BapA prefix-like domain-containing protein [Pseudomonas schmalbachii]
MTEVELIAKIGGQVVDASAAGQLQLTHPSVVKIATSLEGVKSISKNGDDLVVRFASGEVKTIEGFFLVTDGVGNDLVIETPEGQLLVAEHADPWAGVELVELGSIDELLIEQQGDQPLPFWLLPAMGVAAFGMATVFDNQNGHSNSTRAAPVGPSPDAPEVHFNNLQGLTGMAQPGVEIVLTRPDGTTVTTTADENGWWHFVPNPLGHGETGTVAAVNENGSSEPVSTGPADLIPPVPPVVEQNDADGLAGTAEPGGELVLKLPDGSTQTTTVDENGNWVFPVNPLQPGEEGMVSVTDPAGNHSEEVPTGTLSDELPELDKPIIERVVDDFGSVLSDALEAGQSTDDRTPTVVGTAQAGLLVTLLVNGEAVGSATADDQGRWEITVADLGQDGLKTITARVSDGQSSALSDPLEVHLDTTAPDVPAIERLWDAAGPVHGEIQIGGIGDDNRPALHGRVGAGDAVRVKLYDKGVLIGSAEVGTDGSWSFQPSMPLISGLREFQVSAVDAVGNESAPSQVWGYVINLPGSSEPAIINVYDDVGAQQGYLEKEDVTDDPTPRLFGGGRAGDTLYLYVKLSPDEPGMGTLVGTTTVNALGKWTLTTSDLGEVGGDGHKYLYAASVGVSGMEGIPSGFFEVILDTATRMAVGPQAEQSQPEPDVDSLVQRLLAEHADDGFGRADIDLAFGELPGGHRESAPVSGDAMGGANADSRFVVEQLSLPDARIDLLTLLQSQQLVA